MSTTAATTAPMTATCYCKAFRLTWKAPVARLTRCTCTFCTKKGLLLTYGTPDDLVIDQAGDDRVYVAMPEGPNKHHFCGTCGCALFSATPDWSTGTGDFSKPRIGFNARLLDDVIADELPIDVIDGRNNW